MPPPLGSNRRQREGYDAGPMTKKSLMALTLGASVRAGLALAAVVVGCSSSSSPAQTGGTCAYPANAKTDGDASGNGCFAGPPASSCQVSNGATVLADGGVENGTETCQSLCAAGQYELTCRSSGLAGPIPDPDSSLGCQAIRIPTPSNELFYCCPCAG
jgi:hypothetical protein